MQVEIGAGRRYIRAEYRQEKGAIGKDTAVGSWIASLAEALHGKKEPQAKEDSLTVAAGTEEGSETKERPVAVKIYEAVAAGKENQASHFREAAKVPYGSLAKDGVIEYKGVIFVCDEKSNSICLGDMSNPKDVITVPLSGGGSLKVNRNNIGELSKAAGMFSSEDLNRILRAIALDTKLQSMEKEIEEMENSMGEAGSASEENSAGEAGSMAGEKAQEEEFTKC